jgi:hypothetical protein
MSTKVVDGSLLVFFGAGISFKHFIIISESVFALEFDERFLLFLDAETNCLFFSIKFVDGLVYILFDATLLQFTTMFLLELNKLDFDEATEASNSPSEP